MNHTYIFKDVAERIPEWQKWGKQICLIFFAKDINEAIAVFEKKFPAHCVKGRMKATITVSIVK